MVSGSFREDLYYRLNVVHIEMPPLARRREDIPLLVAHFLEQIAQETGQRKIYAPEAVELLATADWPGNVRQLAERRAPERARCRRRRSSRSNSCSSHSAARRAAAVLRRGARRIHAQLPVADPADHRRQRQPGGAPREAQPHGLLQAARRGTSWCRTTSRGSEGS